MPLPKPEQYETDAAFIERCMTDEIMVEDFEDEKQRLAVCNVQLEEGNRNIWNKKYDNIMEKRIFNIQSRN